MVFVFSHDWFLSSGAIHGSFDSWFLLIRASLCIPGFYMHAEVEASKSKRRSRSGWGPVFARSEFPRLASRLK